MVDIFPWSPLLETGFARIDAQHQRLVALLNQLARGFVDGSDADGTATLVAALADYAEHHFADEETLWAAHLPSATVGAHRANHQAFTDKVHALQRDPPAPGELHDTLFGFLAEWLAFHILDSDRTLAWTIQGIQRGFAPDEAAETAKRRMRGSEGALTRAILGLYRHMTAQALLLMRERQQQLRATEANHRAQLERLEGEGLERLHSFLDRLPVGVAAFDVASGQFVSANPVFESMIGHRLDALQGMRVLALHAPEEHEATERQLQAVKAGRESTLRGTTLVRADGSRFVADIHCIRFRLAEQDCVIGLIHDRTEQRWLQEDLLRAQRVARIGSWKLDLATRSLEWSPETYRLFGVEPGTRLTLDSFLDVVHPADRDAVSAAWLAAMDGQPYDVEHRTASGGDALWLRERAEFAAWRDGRPTAVLGTVQDVSERRRYEQRLEFLAYHDGLTGLQNSAALMHAVERAAVPEGAATCFLYLDLDQLGQINAAMGHAAGDRALRVVAERLVTFARDVRRVGRIGGDHFAIVMPGCTDATCLRGHLDGLREALTPPIAVQGERLRLTACVGAVRAEGELARQPEKALRMAAQALYRAKLRGPDQHVVFEPSAYQSDREREERLRALRGAIEADQLTLHLQPKIDLRDGAVVGVEGLLRWQHPERGLLAPSDFLPPFYGHPLLDEVGGWTVRHALALLASWGTRGLTLPISINLETRMLERPDFVDQLAALLAEHPDVPPERLEIEILETGPNGDLQRIGAALTALRALGVRSALDDFGTGQASLQSLRSLRTDTLKIDRSFVGSMLDEPEALAIVRATLGLGQTFDRLIVAEGVETEAQALRLRQLGCHHAQGYLFAAPMPADQLEGWLEAWAARGA